MITSNKTGNQLSIISALIILTVCSAPNASAQTQALISRTSELLFGDLWTFKEYCGDNRDDSTILKDDNEIENFYNKIAHNSIRMSQSSLPESWSNLSYVLLKASKTLPLVCSASSWGYANEELLQQSTSPRSDETECLNKLDAFFCLQTSNCDLPENQYYDAVMQFQSFGETPSGNWRTKRLWPGDYDSCVQKTPGIYCLAKLSLKSWLALDTNSSEYGFQVGVCMPDTCSTRILQKDNIKSKIESLLKYKIESQFKLNDVYCLPAKDSSIQSTKLIATKDNKTDLTSMVLLIVLPLLWLSTIIYKTIFEKPEEKDRSAFDIRSGWANLTESHHIDVNLAGLNGIKVICMIWLMVAHVYHAYLSFTDDTLEFREKINRSPFISAILMQGQHGVPPFFIISGLLIGLKELPKESLTSPFKMIIQRYFRLIPMYLLIYTYVRKFAHLMGDGPFWDYGVSRESETLQCHNESWLVPILMLSNYIPPFSHCILTGWHVANDFQMHLLPVTIILAAYHQSWALGRLVAILGFAISHFYHALNIISATNIDFRHVLGEPFAMGPKFFLGRLAYAYVEPIGRIGAFYLGILMADMLLSRNFGLRSRQNLATVRFDIDDIEDEESFELEKEKRKIDRKLVQEVDSKGKRLKDKLMVGLGVVFVFISATTPTWSGKIENYLPSDMIYIKLLYPLNKLVGELSWFVMLYWLLRGQCRIEEKNSKQDSRFSLIKSTHWNVFVKLNYVVMLIHFTVARYVLLSQRQLLEFSWFQFSQFVLFFIVFNYSLAFFIYIIVEAPMTLLLKRLLINRL